MQPSIKLIISHKVKTILTTPKTDFFKCWEKARIPLFYFTWIGWYETLIKGYLTLDRNITN